MRLISTITMIILLAVSNAALAVDSPNSFVRGLESEVRSFLASKDAVKANSVFAEKMDMAKFGQRCLADHWSEFSDEEISLYLKFLEAGIKKRISERTIFAPDGSHFSLKLKSSKKDEGQITRLESLLETRGRNLNLAIFLVRREGELKVADYELDGALLSRSYRGQFNYLIRKYGKAGFLEKLRNKSLAVALK